MKHRFAAAVTACWLPVIAVAERVHFPGADVALAGWLERPGGPGPHPAVVLLHGCSGPWARDGRPTALYAAWLARLKAEGYVALLVDSFGPRGEREICTQARRSVSPVRHRPLDAEAALRWLGRDASVDARRIHLMGWSNGGTAVLAAAARPPAGGGPGFRSAIAFYPGCAAIGRRAYRPAVPLLILAGGADDWTPASACESLVSSAAENGAPIRIEVYPGAHHGFDAPVGRVRRREDVRNPASPGGWGATLGPHPAARAAAVTRALGFLSQGD